MTEDDVIRLVTSMPGVVAVTASEANGAPEAAWGDTFFYYDPDGDGDRRLPFATVVTQDYEGFDTASALNRPGVFRLNLAVGRERFEALLGYPPSDHAEHADRLDYAALDRLLPHPTYAAQGWVSILNPGPQAESLIAEAHGRAASRRRRKG